MVELASRTDTSEAGRVMIQCRLFEQLGQLPAIFIVQWLLTGIGAQAAAAARHFGA